MEFPIKISAFDSSETLSDLHAPYYFIGLLDGDVLFSVDFHKYQIGGKYIFFLSPYQLLQWDAVQLNNIRLLQFHGDFYCIEYHKAEVACNGILFNNIYTLPYIAIDDEFFNEISLLFDKIKILESSILSYDLALIRTYLQLILALCNKQKQLENGMTGMPNEPSDVQSFKTALDMHFATSKSVSFYASQYGLSVNAFSKKIRNYYGKNPSQLIRERVNLEAKRLLHLTFMTVKEIAAVLGFEDEFYFSRYFKKEVGVPPKTFRETVGISIVAEKSM